MQVIKELTQGTPEWLEARKGKVTASCFDNVLAKGKGNAPSKTRQTYMYQLAAERITGLIQDSFTNSYMEWGTENEPVARNYYELVEGVTTEQVGLILYNDDVGASPDSLVGNDGLLEIKCPKSSTQIERILSGVFPADHTAQVQGQLWISEREWCDFVSFDPRINSDKKYFKVRVNRDEEYIKTLAHEVSKFVEELKELVFRIEEKKCA